MNKKIILASALSLCGIWFGLNGFAQGPAPGKPTGEIAAAAKKFLATLDDAQRGKAVFDFKDASAGRIYRREFSDEPVCAWATSHNRSATRPWRHWQRR